MLIYTCNAPWEDRRNLPRPDVAVCELDAGHRGDHSGVQVRSVDLLRFGHPPKVHPLRLTWTNWAERRRDAPYLRDGLAERIAKRKAELKAKHGR